jgi:hypothetical protein
VWDENGRYPDVIVELLSESTQAVDKGTKKQLYERVFHTRNYFIFDPFDANSLQGWHLDASQKYQPLELDSRGWLWCQSLGFYLGTWQGTIDRETGVWLRFYDPSGNLMPLPEEVAAQNAEQERQRAEQERQRAERLAARLRELGEDPELL